MSIRATAILGVALVAGVMSTGCSSQPDSPDTSAGSPATSAAAHPEQGLLEDLTIANRILGRQLAILDIQGHVTARSRVNPNHYYIARYVSPGGASVSDFIENDLASSPVHGPRTDQAREIYLHGEIYKARPDVMAVVHAHTPEFVAFSMSSVPLWNGDSPVPVWDIRPFNKGRSGIVSTPALGRAMAETLGTSEAVLLWGHGIALTAASLPDAITRVDDLRDAAQLQQKTTAMGGTWTPAARLVDTMAAGRTWDFHKRAILNASAGIVPASPEPTPEKPSDPLQATMHDLMLANRILVSDELRILDTVGHVSVRHPGNAAVYLVAPAVAPGAVTVADGVPRDSAAAAPDDQGLAIHDEIYKARPDVNAVLYARTPEIVALTHAGAPLRPVVNGGAFIGNGLPVFDIGALNPRQPLADPALGGGVARALGKAGSVVLPRHGFVLTAPSIYNLVDRAYQLRLNAVIQQQAVALRGRVAYLNERPAEPVQANESQPPAPTGPPEGRAWIYWTQNLTLD